MVQKIAPFPNYPTLASVLNGTARSAKNSLFIIFIKNVSQLGMNKSFAPPPLPIQCLKTNRPLPWCKKIPPLPKLFDPIQY